MDNALILYQGHNNPIPLIFPEAVDDALAIRVQLSDGNGTVFRVWEKTDLVINGRSVKCPVLQAESAEWKPCRAYIDAHYIDSNTKPKCNAKAIPVQIRKDNDKTVLGTDDPISVTDDIEIELENLPAPVPAGAELRTGPLVVEVAEVPQEKMVAAVNAWLVEHQSEIKGDPGEDGVSPAASVSKSGTVSTFTVTDKDGTTTVRINDGEKGETGPAGAEGPAGPTGSAGADGFSPVATVTRTETGAVVSITDKNGTTTATINDGATGATGPQGPQGIQGEVGPQGPQGETGPAGSDAEVTTENIEKALGYTPADDAAIGEINTSLTQKLTVKQNMANVASLDETILVNDRIVEVAGTPQYVDAATFADYSEFDIQETGWYVFARIDAADSIVVSTGYSISGAKYIIPNIGDAHIDVAVRFEASAYAKIVDVNWGTYTERITFKATDLAIRNLDYRVTYYVYDISPYTTWTYALTDDTTFVQDKQYFTIEPDGTYTKAEVTAGDAVESDTYYVHSSCKFEGFPLNISYISDLVDCPLEVVLPVVKDGGYGAWFEIQTTLGGSYSFTFTPPTGTKMSKTFVQTPAAGINVINVQYNLRDKVWLVANNKWAL